MSRWTEIKRLRDQLQTQGLYPTLIAAVDKLIRWVTGRPSYTFGWITPAILLGGQPARKVWGTLIRRGITGVINLRHEYDYQAEIGSLALRYLYLPTVDNTAPSQEHIRIGVQFLEEELSKGGKVYVHCWEGLGRSPTLVAAYLVKTGLTPEEAWTRIRRVRPFIRPTQGQRERLEEYALESKSKGLPSTSQQSTPLQQQINPPG
jgi:protein-tyrosine phosphatase